MPGPAQTYLDTLTTTLLLGADRAGTLPQTPPPGRLAARTAQTNAADRESALLDLAAAASPWSRAGAAPQPAGPPPDPAPPDDRPPCPPGPAAILTRLLRSTDRDMLREWLDLARARNFAVLFDAIPDLLDVARQHAALREPIIAAIGPRGRWLAAMNPDWSFANLAETSNPEELWQTGTLQQRLLLLRDLRRRDPVRALTLVQSTWATDPTDDRANFLTEFTHGLSMADEPFLESCLDDKRKPVRAGAATLLQYLPESRFAARMLQRVTPLLNYEPPRKKSAPGRITATLPSAFDKSWARDGIEEKPPQGTGERQWWLQQILSMTPPSTWSSAWKADPATLLAAADDSDWRTLLLTAWAAAAATFADQDWAEALLGWWVDNPRSKVLHSAHANALLATLDPPRRERFVLGLLPHKEQPRVGALILQIDHEWSPEFSRAILRYFASSDKPPVDLKLCIGCFHHTTVPDLAAHFEKAGKMDELASHNQFLRLEFRAQMHREFNA